MRTLMPTIRLLLVLGVMVSVASVATAQDSASEGARATQNVGMTLSVPLPEGWTQEPHATDVKLMDGATSGSPLPTTLNLRLLRLYDRDAVDSTYDELRGQGSEMVRNLSERLSQVGRVLTTQILPADPARPEILCAVELRVELDDNGTPVVLVMHAMSVAGNFDSAFSVVIGGVEGVDFSSMTTLALSLLDQAQLSVAGR